MENPEEVKLQTFLQWLHANKVEFHGCKIKFCGPNKGFGLFYNNDIGKAANGVLLAVPLDLAITPMRVLEDPYLGPKCRAMFEEGEVDDRFLINLFLTVERLRKNSAWKPYLDMLPTTFGNPLWFSDDELLELKGTTLYRATELQKKKLQSLYEDKVKDLVMELLDGKLESEVNFKDFLWANSIFWTRALNIPFPRSYVFPQMPEEQENCPSLGKEPGTSQISNEALSPVKDEKGGVEVKAERTSNSTQGESIWVEGLVPGIDFCNHDLRAAATWEVDTSGLTTGVPASMYLLSVEQSHFQIEKEVCISYGNKGNEELLYLYGFVMDANPDDYLMVHYPIEALQNVPFADTKGRLLEVQRAEMRCLLPRKLLDRGFFSATAQQCRDSSMLQDDRMCNYSWSGQRKMPSYSNKLVFPEDFLTALRTIAMKEEELNKVSSLLEEEINKICEQSPKRRTSCTEVGYYQWLTLSFGVLPVLKLIGSGEEREPSDTEVRAAIWEASGNSGALQLLVDLLQMKITELEEGSGTEACDTDLLEKVHMMNIPEGCVRDMEGKDTEKMMSRNRWSSIIYRRGQKQLTRLFLMEAENALQLCLIEEG